MPEDASLYHHIILNTRMLPAAMTQLSLRQTSLSAVWDLGDGVVVDSKGIVVVEVVVVVVVVVVGVAVVVVVGLVVVVVCSTVVEVVGSVDEVVPEVGLPLSTK